MILLVLGAAFMSAEVGLRIFASPQSPLNQRLGRAKQIDPVTKFRTRPNYDLGNGIRTDRHGWLAPADLSPRIPEGRMRILYIGDSATVSPLPHNYPFQVESILAARGETVETVNTAVPGFAAENALAMYESEIAQYDADFVFIYLGWNNLGQYGPEGLPYKRAQAGLEISPLQTFLAHFYTPRIWYEAERYVLIRFVRTVDEPLTDSERAMYEDFHPAYFDKSFRRLLRLTRERYPHVWVLNLTGLPNEHPTDAELHRLYFPVGMGKNARKLYVLMCRYNDAIEAAARDEQVLLIDLHAAFDNPQRLENFHNTGHLTPKGARRVAELLVEAIDATRSLRGQDAGPHVGLEHSSKTKCL